MPEWGFPNFDSRLDEPDYGAGDPAHIREWRTRKAADAQRCQSFTRSEFYGEICRNCGGPKHAHSVAAMKGAA